MYAVYGEGPARLSGGPSYLRLRPQTFHWSYTWLMVVQLTFDFEVQLLRSIYQKERQGYGDRSGPRILEIDPVILKLSQFSEVKVNANGLCIRTARYHKILRVVLTWQQMKDRGLRSHLLD